MANKSNVILELTEKQRDALQKLGLEADQISVDAKTGASALVNPRKPGLLRLTTEQSKSIKSSVAGSPDIAGIETNPKTFGIDLVTVSDARRIKAMWGEGSE